MSFWVPTLPGIDLDVTEHRGEIEFVDPEAVGDASIRAAAEDVVDVGSVELYE